MRRFRFSLDTVLTVRRRLEEARQRDFAAVKRERDACLGALGASERGVAALIDEQAAWRGQAGPVDVFQELAFQSRRRAYYNEARRLRVQLRELEGKLEAARLVLVQASRERRVLERLEEKQFEGYMIQSRREEQAFMDELAAHAALTA